MGVGAPQEFGGMDFGREIEPELIFHPPSRPVDPREHVMPAFFGDNDGHQQVFARR
jgi:hypothetical protein